MRRDVLLRVEGALLEKLLQRALDRGARFARIRRSGARAMTLATDDQGAQILLGLCKKYGLNLRVLRRGGMAALRDRLRARWTLLPCAALGLLLCALALSRLWWVDVRFTGPCAELGSRVAILQALESSGVRAGMPAAKIDADGLQRQLLAECAGYSFIGVRRQGVRLLVEASPEVPAPQLYALHRARDLVAARDGVVESISVRAGVACVKPGDTVRAGDLLIRGEERKSDEETAPVAALGEVVARCWFEDSARAPLEQRELRRTGRASRGCRLRLFGMEFVLSPCERFDSEEVETEILPVGGLFLPLELERCAHYETRAHSAPADGAALEARLSALSRAGALRKIAVSGADFDRAQSWTEASRADGFMTVRAVYEIYTDIAVTRDALTEEVY